MIAKHLTRKREKWPLYTAIASYAMNILVSQEISDIPPFELCFEQKTPDLLNLAFPPLEQYASSHIDYLQLLKQIFEHTFSILKNPTGTR